MRKLTVYESIDRARAEAKLSKKELADKIGVSEVQICRYLNGVTKIPADRLPAFADAIGCQVAVFFDQATESVSSSSLN